MAKCEKLTKKVSEAGKELQDEKSTKKEKTEAAKILVKHRDRNHK